MAYGLKVSSCDPLILDIVVTPNLKGALDKYNIIPKLFSKTSWDFYTIRSVGKGSDCMLSFTL